MKSYPLLNFLSSSQFSSSWFANRDRSSEVKTCDPLLWVLFIPLVELGVNVPESSLGLVGGVTVLTHSFSSHSGLLTNSLGTLLSEFIPSMRYVCFFSESHGSSLRYGFLFDQRRHALLCIHSASGGGFSSAGYFLNM